MTGTRSPKAAASLALSAYLDGFEPIEPQLAARNPDLLHKVEAAMGAYRALISRMAPPEELQERAKEIEGLFNESAAVLQHRSRSRIRALPRPATDVAQHIWW